MPLIRRRSWLVIPLLFGLVISVGCSAPSEGEPSRLTLASNRLVLGGSRFVMVGVAVYTVPFYAGSSGGQDAAEEAERRSADQHSAAWFAAIRADGFNTVRFPLTGDPAVMRAYGYTPSSYAARVAQLVRQAQGAGLTVVLAWFDASSYGRDLAAHYRDDFPAMKLVYQAVRGVPGVLLEPFNEPNGVDWTTWQNVTQKALDFIRGDLGYRGVVILDTIDYSWSFSTRAADAVQAHDRGVLGSPPQVLFVNHRYANNNTCFCGQESAQWQAEIGQYEARYPLVIGEFGNFNAGMGPSSRWVSELVGDVVTNAVPHGLNGGVAFVWNWVDANSMTEPGGLQLTAYGKLVVDGLAQPLARGKA